MARLEVRGRLAPGGQHAGHVFLEERAGILRIQTEIRVRPAQDAAPRDDLDAPAREDVEGRVVLGRADRVERAEQRHARGEAQAAGALGDRREHDRRRGEDVVAQVVLAQPD